MPIGSVESLDKVVLTGFGGLGISELDGFVFALFNILAELRSSGPLSKRIACGNP